MSYEVDLRKQFNGEDGTFLLRLRGELVWDKQAFSKLTSLMYKAATDYHASDYTPTWIASGFWFCDTWVKEWTTNENFPRPDSDYYISAIELLHDLAYFLFIGESPFTDNTLERLSNG